MIFNICDFGAKNGGTILNTKSIQGAIDACESAGGGTVFIPAGLWLSGTIRLKSHMELHLEQGAILRASPNLDDYNPEDEYPQNFGSQAEEWTGCHLIIAHELEDVAITGPGVIDGNADAFFGDAKDLGWASWRSGLRLPKDKIKTRPGPLIAFVESSDIRIRDLSIRNSPCWTLLLHGCENIQVHGIDIRNGIADANTDGIDIDCCQNVIITGALIDTGDDAIAIRASGKRLKHPRPCENIVISDCVLAASSCGFRIGVGNGKIRNVMIANTLVRRAGDCVTIQSAYTVRKGEPGVDISDISLHHVRIENSGVFFTIETAPPEMTSGAIRNIEFDSCSFEAFHDGHIRGNQVHYPEDIRFLNCEFIVTENSIQETVKCPEYLFGQTDAKNIQFHACRIRWKAYNPARKRIFAQPDFGKIENCDFPEPPRKG